MTFIWKNTNTGYLFITLTQLLLCMPAPSSVFTFLFVFNSWACTVTVKPKKGCLHKEHNMHNTNHYLGHYLKMKNTNRSDCITLFSQRVPTPWFKCSLFLVFSINMHSAFHDGQSMGLFHRIVQ